jgi:molybdopterin synthase catalytic subunit
MEKIQTIIQITEDELDIDSLIPLITSTATGAVCTFTGVVRGETIRDADELTTEYLEYEAYVPMAEAKMEQVAGEIRKKWSSIEGIAIIQRIGRLYPKTPTVVIACASSHRNTGVFEATRYGIDRLKEIVPIWKKEVSQDGETWIEGDHTPKPRE